MKTHVKISKNTQCGKIDQVQLNLCSDTPSKQVSFKDPMEEEGEGDEEGEDEITISVEGEGEDSEVTFFYSTTIKHRRLIFYKDSANQ